MDVARDDMDLLVVTENGYGKRTQIGQYRKTNRGAKGVKTIGLTEKKGGLAGALVVREHQELVFISVGGMVQRTAAGGISQQGRSATGVRVMNLKEDDLVSAVALVVDGDGEPPTSQRTGRQTTGESRSCVDRQRLCRASQIDDSVVPEAEARGSAAPRERPCRASPPFATLARPEKGGGPNVGDSSCGTLEVTGR